MKTKQQKIKEWLIEQGYDHKKELDCLAVYYNKKSKYLCLANKIDDSELLYVVGLFKGANYIPTPDFQDDIPEPKDKALQEYLTKEYFGSANALWRSAAEEINSRLKAIEAEVFKGDV